MEAEDIGYVLSTPNVPEFLTTREFLKFFIDINKKRIKDFCETNNFNCLVTDNLESATNLAFVNSEKGDAILLSPACASWDQFECFEDRGNLFKNTAKRIGEDNESI